LSKKLSVLFIGFVMLLSVLVPKASFADSLFEVAVTISGEEYTITNETNSFEINVDDMVADLGIQETDKVEKISVSTPDGVESITFEFLALSALFPDATIQVANNKAEYVVSERLGELDQGSDGVSIQNLRQLMYPVNNEAWVTATVDYANGDYDVLDMLFTSANPVEIPAANAVELTGISLMTNEREVPLVKDGSNQFYLDLAGNNGDVQVNAIKFKSPTAKTVSIFSNDSSLYKEETELTFVNGEAVVDVNKLINSDLAEILGEDGNYLASYQELKYMVASLFQNTFNGYVAAADGSQSPFQVVVSTDGFVEEGGKVYFYDIDGLRVTGWVEFDGEWYYFNPKGGAMLENSWLLYGGQWYYMGADGVMVTGWQTFGDKTYYFVESGEMARGLFVVDGKRYFFNPVKGAYEGIMQKGWVKTGGKTYYMDQATGAAITNWKRIDGKWYFFNKEGVMQTGWEFTGGKWYFMDGNGVMKTGWLQQGAKKYFLDTVNGDMVTAWKYIGGKWYYFEKKDGFMKTGWVYDAKKWYFMDNSGVMKKGWVFTGGKWYFLDNSGAMKTGWIYTGGKWYYLYKDGAMAKNTVIDGYRLGSDGAWIR
jgi:glucan-binding repeat-containing protein